VENPSVSLILSHLVLHTYLLLTDLTKICRQRGVVF